MRPNGLERGKKFSGNFDDFSLYLPPPAVPVSYTHLDVYKRQAFPPSVYVVWLAAKQLYLPQWSRQVDIFSLYWKLLLGFLAAAALFGVFPTAASMAIPSAAVTLICSVLLMRSLRHDPEAVSYTHLDVYKRQPHPLP